MAQAERVARISVRLELSLAEAIALRELVVSRHKDFKSIYDALVVGTSWGAVEFMPNPGEEVTREMRRL